MATTAESATTEVKKMNTPSALHGAMSRDRKPFTYTPGGLDLSEIKSERMAKRLMRNAMNQGVPDLPAQAAQPPSTPSAPIAVPNFNCLPVQVFPTFQLPANPKSLLRTRSTPDKSREPPTIQQQPQHLNNFKPSGMVQLRETTNNNTPLHIQVNNNNYNNGRPATMYEYSSAAVSSNKLTGDDRDYQSDLIHTKPALPEMCYDAEYFQVQPKYCDEKQKNIFADPVNTETAAKLLVEENLKILSSNEYIIQPLCTDNGPAPIVIKPVEDNAIIDVDDEQREVKVVKKQVKKKVESQNGEHNGESEAEMTVKLPTKKSAAKTETKVEVVKKVLPDGSVEEIKTTTTKTTIDGKTEITTKIETQITPKEDEEEVEEVEEEEEEEEEENDEVVVQKHVEEPTTIVNKNVATQPTNIANESVKNDSIIKTEETSEITTTKKVVIVQNSNKDEKEEEEEYEEEEEIEPVVEKTLQQPQQAQEKQSVSEQVATKQEQVVKLEQKVETLKPTDDEAKEEVKDVEEVQVDKKEIEAETSTNMTENKKEEEGVEEEEEFEEAEELENKPGSDLEKQPEIENHKEEEKEEEEESEYTDEEIESEKVEISQPKTTQEPAQLTIELEKEVPKEEATQELKIEEKKEVTEEQPVVCPVDPKIPFREPSIPLEKVEDVEIKPIGASGETVSKTHTASTEIIKSDNDLPKGTLSTQTEYNRIENIVTVNRTTKTLDHSYEQLTQQGVPTVKTYFAPDRERVSTSPQPAKPYQPVYPPPMQQPPERRHSLLLERLSTERQMPSEIYQNNYLYNNQSSEQQKQWSQEPQSEVINVSNVKPSTITNQQWYQQSRKENVIYNNVVPAAPDQQWTQSQPQSQPQAQPQTQYQQTYTENINQDSSRSFSNNYQQNSYPTYAPTPSNWASTNIATTIPSINTHTNQYSFLNKESSETYQKTTQQYSSSYVPPPWEQDPGYVAPALPVQTYYQAPPSSSSFSPSSKPGWKPTPSAAGKFSKPVATSYVPPAPNQSFVKPVSTNVEPSKQPGRKTYYSEYERRYITVPESTYIPSDTKFQPQPDPSPQYYYDNNEPSETVEPQWRKELREFSEKTSQTQQQTEQSSVKPPWEDEPKYVKVPTVTYTPTPSWSQTLRPQSHRERSFESEFVESNEWSKTNTLGRSRPLSSYGNNTVEAPISERTRGVSVDRYNPNNYQSPITTEHSPVQTHTLNPQTAPHGYHNPNVPAYQTRASAEPREHSAIPQPRNWGEARASPIQSRSFKYLQWITGTEN